jgi:hypothetical protein
VVVKVQKGEGCRNKGRVLGMSGLGEGEVRTERKNPRRGVQGGMVGYVKERECEGRVPRVDDEWDGGG